MYPAVCSYRVLLILSRFFISFTSFLSLSFSLSRTDPFVLYLSYSSSHTYTHTFSTLPLILHQSILRHVHTNRQIDTRHAHEHTYTHA